MFGEKVMLALYVLYLEAQVAWCSDLQINMTVHLDTNYIMVS